MTTWRRNGSRHRNKIAVQRKSPFDYNGLWLNHYFTVVAEHVLQK